jgi:imidazolonepropionase-like amidohydrolase
VTAATARCAARPFPLSMAGSVARLAAFLVLLAPAANADVVLLSPERIFDGERMREGWAVLVEDERIAWAGPAARVPERTIDQERALPGQTLMPGLIEGHSHVLLHPYDETAWNDQVLRESEAERVARGVNHLRASLMAGVTTMRDLGSEGAGYADVGLRDAVAKGIIPGPRLLVAGRALVATGSYGPKGFHERVEVPLGAETADGYDDLIRVVREQIGRNIDVVKVYADYRWGPSGTAAPTYTQRELETIVEIATSSGRPVVAHAVTAEAMRRAILAGVETIEHGDGATPEIHRLMAERGVALCPTLAAGEAIASYNGWQKGIDPAPPGVAEQIASFRSALAAGVTLCFGGDVGVYDHGDNVVELELMVEYGMSNIDALRAATAVNARLFHLDDRVGRVDDGLLADLVSVDGNPAESIAALRDVRLVMQSGRIVRDAGYE